jgi:hypothetical protein
LFPEVPGLLRGQTKAEGELYVGASEQRTLVGNKSEVCKAATSIPSLDRLYCFAALLYVTFIAVLLLIDRFAD